MTTPENNFEWTPETADYFENARKSNDLGYQVMVEEFGAPPITSNEDSDAFYAWRNEKVASLIHYRIETGNKVNVFNYKEEDDGGNKTYYELGFTVDGAVYNVIAELAESCREKITQRWHDDPSSIPEIQNSEIAAHGKLDHWLRRLFMRANNGDVNPDTKVLFYMHANHDFETDAIDIKTRLGGYIAAEASIKQLEELSQKPEVHAIELNSASIDL